MLDFEDNVTLDLFTNEKAGMQDLDFVYAERGYILAAYCDIVSEYYPVVIAQHSSSDISDDVNEFRTIVVIKHPKGDLSWHIHDKYVYLFEDFIKIENYVWDGTGTEKKYIILETMRDIRRFHGMDSGTV